MSQSPPSPSGPNLDELRRIIDRLDEQLVSLLNQRAEAAREIGRLKNVHGTSVYAPAREKEVLDRVRRLNSGPLPDNCLTAIWREVMSASLALEKPLKIGYLGPAGTFSHLAATAKFGRSVEYVPLSDIADIFDEVARGHADHGLVPLENSAVGGVRETLDGFVGHDSVRICAEVLLRIQHNLIGRAESLSAVRRIYSKPEGFQQCRRWLSGLSGPSTAVELVPVASTARGAELAAEDPQAAAIGSRLAAEIYGLSILCAGIEDDPANTTRFAVIGRESAKRTGDDKTALLLTVPHRSGGLRDVLEVLARHAINLTWLEPHTGGWTSTAERSSGESSRTPLRAPEFRFFLDAEGHPDDANLRSALGELRSKLPRLTLLGGYPRASEPI